MTSTKYSPLARTATPKILELLENKLAWGASELMAVLNLPAPVFKESISDLIGQGKVRQRFSNPFASPPVEATYSRVAGTFLPASGYVLSSGEEQVLEWLVGRKETLATISTALRLPKREIAETLVLLDEKGLIVCRYVNHLPIFSLA
ncbi:hypothetical protein [Deinococcus hopiensis]|uniref:Uncharacterized protein n=1 Tax=Deinococcus hopiensis KR-140 TaxID=695939 RepID=A0A1W1VDP0_9DEIO|nr:hypothetical protein [Deinococcus hopiensis]SMB91161.1 hypothetical protein SAMN00790413_01014 [Deinococcus hopiensis KR-140]